MPHNPMNEIAAGLAAGRLAPYLGPDLLTLDGPAAVPDSALALAAAINGRISVSGRIRNNLWATAQWIESFKHRITLVRLLEDLFAPVPAPTRLHGWLAGLGLPLIVDTWYDTMMADALRGKAAPFVEWQGIRRSGQTYEEPWGKCYDASGAEISGVSANGATVLYKPHGAVRPAANFLISDSDYVEVLTEIDIQTPIPETVIELRGNLGFAFLGCRFYDQMQRTFAHQIIKRSAGPHYAVLTGELTKNERRFLELEGITQIDLPLSEAVDLLIGVGK
ncbi:SIR2 family NAD-dependent protein deacylase [Telmatospirillum siberiense]|uniref:SIR2 family protein n=1 Tax=Telmatospirillum siberiense TaxID=382514 RepID=A0A2N3PND5_9PROT|nr:SIR2 family protein [Telmatospirillum siberiense]PKU21912.1 SIR2 family protein [Telmatospirillum siberiense]